VRSAAEDEKELVLEEEEEEEDASAEAEEEEDPLAHAEYIPARSICRKISVT
jgi:tRNA(Arg) A34 adenosine deaminase TadA